MKNTKYIIWLLVMGLSIMGCSDLEEEPVGLLSPDGFFNTPDDIQIAVDGAMTHAINEEIWGRKLSVALMLRSDMVNLQSGQTVRLEQDMHSISGNNEMVYDPWRRIYLGIAAANNAIAGAEDVDADDALKNPVTAQAYFIRAWYYFHLVRLFGDVPYIDEPIDGTNAEFYRSIGCTPEAEVYEKIIADLEYAEQWLPEATAASGIPSNGAASSYLALVYLTRATSDFGSANDFATANTYAKKVIDSGVYSLDNNFQNLFDGDEAGNSPEMIFTLDYNAVEADDNAYDQVAPMTGIRGDEAWSVAVPKLEVYNSFDPADYRTRVSFQTEATITVGEDKFTVDYTNFTISGHEHAANVPYIAKYTRFPGPFARGDKRATSIKYPMMRYAEILLIAAECAVEAGDNANAVKYINEVRERARKGGATTNGGYVPETIAASAVPADFSGTATIADVIEERRIELAFECKRWYDIKRRDLGDVVFGPSGLEGAKPDWNASVDYDTPIPQDEIQRNPNLTN
ncbi:RagB/SusD family nutrient uptake outer membrane protein [Tamlana sp. 2_MG-2023]|uniref:RagB/SusD family nutrient uptake outer membrane protein n=1 Tax=unclassified Tamlana TaxID=2614803 RepID=UPI0026E2E9EA|nr:MULTISPECIES: RagB/SusD family nutrient uptake outer membrane protein [unclassified Tamlana]MDO6758862.1 RagB/SusD family nutrient uptake outer membrane protein [Tamlana sp. 2_MG-2023]MDO6789561.1 RagB/SusD family nutrient uptake outer membrane protein [Tamlana sp. 1_MG-2023]